MSQITDICTEVIKKTGVITEAMFQSICEVAKAPDINIGYAADTINSIYGDLEKSLVSAYNAFRKSPAIVEKIDAATVKATRTDVQKLMNQFLDALGKFMREYKKLKNTLTEAASDTSNAEFRRMIQDAVIQEKIIKKSDASAAEKADAMKKVAAAKLEAVHVALQGVDAAYKQFMDAVHKKDPALDQEAALLHTQARLFLKQYNMATGFIVSNMKAYIASGLTICIGTGLAAMTGAPILFAASGIPAVVTKATVANKGITPGATVKKMNALDSAINKHEVMRYEKQLSKRDANLKVAHIKDQIKGLKKAAKYYKKNGSNDAE